MHKKLALLLSAHWDMATTDHKTIWMGIHRSGPIFLDTSWDGSSAKRNEIKKMLCP